MPKPGLTGTITMPALLRLEPNTGVCSSCCCEPCALLAGGRLAAPPRAPAAGLPVLLALRLLALRASLLKKGKESKGV